MRVDGGYALDSDSLNPSSEKRTPRDEYAAVARSSESSQPPMMPIVLDEAAIEDILGVSIRGHP